MSNFVLVHGSWHGAWCWYKIVPRLHALGHHVTAIDLPGHGRDRTDPAEITLDSYVDRIGEAIRRASSKVIVVAHSRGGVPTPRPPNGSTTGSSTLSTWPPTCWPTARPCSTTPRTTETRW